MPKVTSDDLQAMYEWLGGLACSVPGMQLNANSITPRANMFCC